MRSKRAEHSAEPKPDDAGQVSKRRTVPASEVGLSLTLSDYKPTTGYASWKCPLCELRFATYDLTTIGKNIALHTTTCTSAQGAKA